MFKSGYTYAKMFDTVKNEVESYREVPDDIMLLACNSVLQQLYAGVIKEQVCDVIENVTCSGEAAIELTKQSFEDIVRVTVDGEDYTHTSPRRAGTYENTYHKNENGALTIVCQKGFKGKSVEIYYNQRPELIESAESEELIPLPNEYVPMLYAYVRAECYKWINEDSLAAKWMGDYNAQLEGFAAYVAGVKPQFG